MSSPRLSVVMAVRNGETYLPETLKSVLGQSLADFEFLIVDDASTDQTGEILDKTAASDERVRVLRNEAAIGPYPAANRALTEARAPLIARIDADDLCHEERFARQVAFLDENPDHILVGCGYRSIDGTGRVRYTKPNRLSDAEFRWISRFRMPAVHPSFCFRASYPDGAPVRYREAYPVAQDYALACDLLAHGKAASLEDMLIDYRMHEANISTTRRTEQNTAAIEIALRHLEASGTQRAAEKFEPFIRTLYAERLPDKAGFQASVRAFRDDLISEDATALRRWKKRRAAGMLAEAFLKGQPRAAQISSALGFVLTAPDFLLPLTARILETKNVLPEVSTSD